MSSSEFPFHIVHHVLPGQYIREYPQATSTTQEDTLVLHVNQYIPRDNPNPQPGDVTIIGAHANGFPKELYEPLWEDLLARSKQHGFRIRAIWIADVAHQGESSVLNEDKLGNDPSWLDHTRDLLHLINLKRDEMPRPIVGIGHSMGGAQLTALSLFHPRLLHSLVLLDPVIQRQPVTDAEHNGLRVPINTRLSTHRRDLWPSREAAAESFRRSPFYQSWDPRVLERWIRHGLRELPTAIYPTTSTAENSSDKPVTLTTTRHQEVFTFSRPNYDHDKPGNSPAIDRIRHPDIPHDLPPGYVFYRAEPYAIAAQLPHVRPSVLYIFGEKSEVSTPAHIEKKLSTTGTGDGGNGGVAAGRVSSVILPGKGHLVAQEATTECADAIARFLGRELRRWREEEDAFAARWHARSKVQKMTVDDWWMKQIGPKPGRDQNNSNNNNQTDKSKL